MLSEKVRQTIKKYQLIRKGDKILVGVSGGPDSLALLLILNELSKKLGFSLYIAHFDHMLRKDSPADVKFVKKIAIKLSLPLACGKADVKKLARNCSTEEAARNARFDFFLKTSKKIKADKLALAHNLEDQAETVLMRILRGTGLYGLSGILPKRSINSLEVIRPLIETKRNQIEAYLKEKRIKPRLDSSNLEDIYFRNKIRNRLIPLLEKEYSPNIKELLANLAENSGSDYRLLNKLAASLKKGKATSFNLKSMKKLDIAIRRMLFRRAIAKLQGDTRRISFRHINEIEDLALNRPLNSIVDVPGGISVAKRKSLVFYRRKSQ